MIDWAEHWRGIVEAREAQAARLRELAGLPRVNFWDQRAEGFRRATQSRAGDPDRVLEVVSSRVGPETSVLDVGAGVGRYALPLARRAREVIAVEPSQGMRALLEADAADEGLTNLRVVPSSWEEAEVESCAVVLCSHVVYAVPDIRNFVEKLQAHTMDYGFMVVRTRQMGGQTGELWRQVHGEERCPEPSFIELYNVLYQCLGVCANVETIPFRIGRGPLAAYDSLEEALAQVRGQLFLPEGSPQEALVRAYVAEHLVEQDGRLVLPGPSTGAAILWWSNLPESWNQVQT